MRRAMPIRGPLALIAATAVALGGCSDNTDTTTTRDGTATFSPKQDPATDLAQAATRLQQDTYKMTMTMQIGEDGGRLTGLIDPQKDVGTYTATPDRSGTTATQWLVIGNVLYLRMTAPDTAGHDGKTWRRINPETTSADLYDGTAMTTSLEKAVDVQRAGDHEFIGTLDLTASAKALGVPVPQASSIGPAQVPFKAATDTAGRLVRYTLDTPDSDNATTDVTITFSDFGIPVNVQAPPASQISTTSDR